MIEAIRMALSALRANKLRSALTLLGMVIGVFAIIASVTAVEVIDVYFKDAMSSFGSNTFTLERSGTGRARSMNEEPAPPITYEQVQLLQERVSSPVKIEPHSFFDLVALKYRDRETEPNIRVIGSNEHFTATIGYEIQEGRSITPEDLYYTRSVLLIGADVAEYLFPGESPVGKELRVKGHPFRIIGVLAAKGSFLGWSQDTYAIAPLTTLFQLYGGANERGVDEVMFQVGEAHQMAPAMDEVIGDMRVIRGLRPGEANDFEVAQSFAFRKTLENFTSSLTLGGAIIGLITLLAAGIGIMNIMLVSVTERTREIGLRKAVGATRRDIMRQFLLEALVLCMFGGLIGIVLGGLVGNLAAVFFGISAAFPWDWAVGAVIMVAGVAVVFGGYPALRAARLEPIDALRYE